MLNHLFLLISNAQLFSVMYITCFRIDINRFYVKKTVCFHIQFVKKQLHNHANRLFIGELLKHWKNTSLNILFDVHSFSFVQCH